MTKIKDRRQATGLSQSQLAAKVPGLSVRTLQDWDCGRRDFNRCAVLTAYHVARALDCRIEDLIDIDDEQ